MHAATSKAGLRAAALAKRDALSSEERAAASEKLAKRGLPFEITDGMIVSGYSPIRNEIDPTPLMQQLAGQGARLALPAVAARGQSLIFRAWSPGDKLMLGPLGIPEPSPAAPRCCPTSCWCRSRHSTVPATASATAPGITTLLSRIFAR